MVKVKPDTIVFGSATMDVFLVAPLGKVHQTKRTVCLPLGSKVEVQRTAFSSGGGGTNVAVGLSRLGLKTGVVARMGLDDFSPLIIKELKKEGVETRLLAVVAGEETDYGTILLGKNGERIILISRGPTRLEEENISWHSLESRWFHIASLEGNLKLVYRLCEYAAAEKIKVAWNPGMLELRGEKKWQRKILEKVQILIINEEEAVKLIGLEFNSGDFWKKVMSLPVFCLVITQGKKGAWLVFPGEKIRRHFKAIRVTTTDATGAGDAFCSGFLAALLQEKTYAEAMRWGLANGASAVTKYGAKSGLLDLAGMTKWLKK